MRTLKDSPLKQHLFKEITLDNEDILHHVENAQLTMEHIQDKMYRGKVKHFRQSPELARKQYKTKEQAKNLILMRVKDLDTKIEVVRLKKEKMQQQKYFSISKTPRT